MEGKLVREDPNVGGNVKNRIAHRIHNVTAYAWVLSDTFSLQWDIQYRLNVESFKNARSGARQEKDRRIKPDFALIRQQPHTAHHKHVLLALKMAGIPSMNSLHSLYNFFDPPWVLAQLSRIQGRIGKDQFPTVATTMLPNATSLRRYRKRLSNSCSKMTDLLEFKDDFVFGSIVILNQFEYRDTLNSGQVEKGPV